VDSLKVKHPDLSGTLLRGVQQSTCARTETIRHPRSNLHTTMHPTHLRAACLAALLAPAGSERELEQAEWRFALLRHRVFVDARGRLWCSFGSFHAGAAYACGAGHRSLPKTGLLQSCVKVQSHLLKKIPQRM
jgi:hypothetical protein